MHKRRFTLLTALVVSFFLHIFLVAGGEISFPDFYSSPDEILERKAPTDIKRVAVTIHTPASTKANTPPGIRYIAARPKIASAIKKTDAQKAIKAKKAKKEKIEELAQKDTPARNKDSSTQEPVKPAINSAIKETPRPPLTPAPVAAFEPPPAFPIKIEAVLEARYNGIPFTIKQVWAMEGLRYAIALNARRFGFHFEVTSEGNINPEGGLSPEHYRLLLNKKLRTFSDYANGEIKYGKPSTPKTAPLPLPPQDTASLPFHIAVTFNGQAQTVLVTTGNNVYQVRLVVDAEEKIKLPTGVLRTLHLRGERFDMQQGKMVTGYEIWLAPDYLNYPVKFIGHTGNGDEFEYRIKQLTLEDKLVLGDKNDKSVVPENEAIPDWIRQRFQSENERKH
jgi:hypothetical protein